jgi:nitrate/TMAO reductase-like tetraheme cytochrome c subunit
MRHIYFNILRALSSNWIGKLGVVLTTSSFITFIFLEVLSSLGAYSNAFYGLISYLLLPAMFTIGLIFIPIGWIKYQKQCGKTTKELLYQTFNKTNTEPKFWGSKVFLLLLGLTLINVIFMIGSTTQTLHFMESSQFCGTACHSVMGPEYTVYQNSSHANVACVECHVGDGIESLIKTKMDGARMMVKAILNTYQRPIPTPVHNLRPARHTCEKCHWPEKHYGTKLKQFIHYNKDEFNTPSYTTLNIKIDAREHGVHWHVNSDNMVRYESEDEQREKMLWVDVLQSDDSWKRFENKTISSGNTEHNVREMDCIDCHNRATHVFENPDKAIDLLIYEGKINRKLPFIKREALSIITKKYHSINEAFRLIEKNLTRYYDHNHINISQNDLNQAISELQKLYNRNIHPEMNIGWEPYQNHLGHTNDSGCFRCHNNDMVDNNGAHIPTDCTLCHSILANDSDSPFQYILEVDSLDSDREMHQYLRDKFLIQYSK